MTSEEYADNALKEKIRQTIMTQFGFTENDLKVPVLQTTLDLLVNQVMDSDSLKTTNHDSIPIFEKLGRQVTPIRGACWFSKAEVALDYDGVQYIISPTDAFGNIVPEKEIITSLERYDFIVSKYHSIIKEAYTVFDASISGDIWVLISGALTPQVFFGDRDGYIAALYFNEEKSKRKRLSLHSQNKRHNKLVKSLHGEKFVTQSTTFTG